MMLTKAAESVGAAGTDGMWQYRVDKTNQVVGAFAQDYTPLHYRREGRSIATPEIVMADDKEKRGGHDRARGVSIAQLSISHLLVAFGVGIVIGMKSAALKGRVSGVPGEKLPGEKWVTDNRG